MSTDALRLLTATFNFVLTTDDRLERLLDICSLAAQQRVELVQSSLDTDVAALTTAIEDRLDS